VLAQTPLAKEVATFVSLQVSTARPRGFELPAFEESWGLNRTAYDRAEEPMAERGSFSNKRYVALVDMSHHSNDRRFFLFDLASGKLERHNLAHGSGSDPKSTGYARLFANTEDAEKTSLGAYKTAGVYHGKHGQQLRLEELDDSNSHALDRGIVLHGASYVVDERVVASVIKRVKGGALLVIWK
jgi:hypothetical protein